jgi:hypothetical protein
MRLICLDFLRHHADMDLVAAVVAEAVEAEAVIEVAEKGNVVLEHDVGSPDSTPGNTSDSGRDDGSDEAAGAYDTGGTIDYSICVWRFTQYAVKDLEIGKPINSDKCS